MKYLIVLVLGLVIGAAGGVWWGYHNPDQAANVVSKEQKVLDSGKQKMDELDKRAHETAPPSIPTDSRH